jgi:hypothetical protein
MNQRRASLFFTADTLVAVLVLVGAFLMIQSSYASTTQQDDPQQTLIQINNFFRETTIEDLQTEYPGLYSPPSYDGQADPWRNDFTLYQELIYLLDEHNDTIAGEFLNNVTRVVGPGDRFSYRYEVDDTTIYSRETTPINESPAYVTKRVLVYSLVDDGSSIVGPNRTAVAVWL